MAQAPGCGVQLIERRQLLPQEVHSHRERTLRRCIQLIRLLWSSGGSSSSAKLPSNLSLAQSVEHAPERLCKAAHLCLVVERVMRDAQRIGHQRRAALAVRKELDDDGVLVGERMGHRSVGGVGATDGKREQRALEA